MNSLDNNYLELIEDIIENGYTSSDRTGTGTKKVFGREIRHKMSEGFPILTTKEMFSRGVIEELLWFLSGSTNTKYLIDKKVYIWVGDCYKKYLKDFEASCKGTLFNSSNEVPMTEKEFIEYIQKHDYFNPFVQKYADIGPGYGKQWRQFGPTGGKDQIKEIIKTLKTNPDSRRIMLTAWDPNTVDKTTLPPCHYGFQLFTRELTLKERNELYINEYNGSSLIEENLDKLNIPKRAISLKWNQRSVDSLLGLPFNIMSYGLLLEMIAQQVNMVADELIGSFGDTHVYLNQVEIFEEKQKHNEGFPLPKLKLRKAKDIFSYKLEDIEIINYKHNGKIVYPLSN